MKLLHQIEHYKALGDSFRAAHRFAVSYDRKRVETDRGHAYRDSPPSMAFVEAAILIDDIPFAITLTSSQMSAHLWGSDDGDEGECHRAAQLFGVEREVLRCAIDPILEPFEDELIDLLPPEPLKLTDV